MDTVFILGLFSLVASVDAAFDCGRPGGSDLCLAGSTCDLVTGLCVCSDVRTGYNCGLFIGAARPYASTEKNLTPCPAVSPCINGGTCLGDGTDATCFCTENYVGDICQTPRYDYTCGVGQMTISVIPFGDFSDGLMYVEGDPDCTLDPETPGTPGGRYSLTLPHSGGTCIDAITSDSPDERYTRRVVVLYSGARITGRDELVIVKCGSDLITTASSLTVGELNQGLIEHTLGTVPENTDINFQLTAGGSVITDPLYLGDDVTVTFSLTDQGNQKFTAYRVESCVATNNLPSIHPEYMSATFIINACHAGELASVLSQPMQTGSTVGSVRFVFEAFKFRSGSGNELLVQCVVKMCRTEQGCEAVSCPGDPLGSPGGLGRRRRDAEEERTLTRVLSIKPPLSGSSDETPVLESQDCTRTGVHIGVAIAMATIIFLLVVLCLTLVLREFNKRKIVELDTTSQSSTLRLAPRQSVI